MRLQLRKTAVLWVTVLLLISTVSGSVVLAKTTSGGNTSLSDLGSGPAIQVQDATITPDSDSKIEIAYRLPSGTDPANVELDIGSFEHWYAESDVSGSIDSQEGVLTLTVPQGTFEGGEHLLQFSLRTKSYETLATDRATLSVESPVTIEGYSFESGTVNVNEQATAEVDLSNPSTSEQSYTLTLYSYNSYDDTFNPEATKTVTVPAEGTKTVSLSTTFGSSGTKSLAVNQQSLTELTVEKSLTVTDYSISSGSVDVGQPVTVSFTVENTDGPSGDYWVSFSDPTEDVYEDQQVTLDSGQSQTVEFTFTPTVPGTHDLRLNNDQIVELTVTSPIEVTAYSVDTKSVYKGESIQIDATLKNTGTSSGTFTVPVQTEYNTLATTTVDLDPGQTTDVTYRIEMRGTGDQELFLRDNSFTVDVKPVLELVDYSFSKEEVAIGEEVTLHATVKNAHGQDGVHEFGVSAWPSEDYASKTVELAPGEQTTVDVTATFNDVGSNGGTFYLLDDRASVDVYNPVEVTDYSLPETATVGKPVTVTATVENTGSSSGTYPVALRGPDGYETYGKKSVKLDSGKSTEVTFTATFPTAKQYDLHLNSNTDPSIRVSNPVSVTDYTLSDTELYKGETVTVDATVENTGPEEGTYPVTLKKWGRSITQTDVTLGSGEDKEITFDLTIDQVIHEGDQVSLNDKPVNNLRVKSRITPKTVDVPDGVEPGEEVSVTVTYHNPTDQASSTYVDTKLGDQYDNYQLTLGPGEEEVVTMTGTYDEPGTKYEWIESRSVKVFVYGDSEGTPNLQVSGDHLNTRAVVDQQTYLTVNVQNTGDAAGTTEVSMSVDGTQLESERVYAEPGSEDWASFPYTFTETGTHTITINGEQTYEIEVVEPVVTNTEVTHVSGPEPSVMPTVRTQLGSAGGVFAMLQAPSGHVDIGGLGATPESAFRIELTLRDYTPRVLINTGHDTTWSTEKISQDKTRVTILISPSQLNFRENPPTIENWESGDDSADTTIDAGAWMALGDAENSRFDVEAEAVTGMTVSTDAQRFRQPRYVPGDADTPPKLEVRVAGPHLTTDGEINQGHYDAFLPNSLLEAWDVSDPSQLTVEYTGEDDVEYTVEEVDGGLEVSLSLHYSSGTVTITKKSESTEKVGSPSGGGGGGSGPSQVASSDVETVEDGAVVSVTNGRAGKVTRVVLPDSASNGKIGVSQLDITPATDGVNLQLGVTPYTDKPDGAPEFDDAVGFIQVEESGVTNDEIQSGTFRFTVSSLPAGVSPSDVVLYRYHDGEWQALETRHASGTTYVAETPGFSYFAIGTAQSQAEMTTTAAPTTTTAVPTTEQPVDTETPVDETSQTTTETQSPGFGILLTVCALLVAALVARRQS